MYLKLVVLTTDIIWLTQAVYICTCFSFSSNPLRNILQYLLHFHNCKINFIWVPGHSGIQGNNCRLRFGHNRLPTTLSRFIPTISPYYPLHPETNTLATMDHQFFRCPKLKPLSKNSESFSLAYNSPEHGLWLHSWPAKTPKFITL